jgi:PAS domain S-box-containing protein
MMLRLSFQSQKGGLLIPSGLLLAAILCGVALFTFLDRVGTSQVQQAGESAVDSISRVIESEIHDVRSAVELMSSSPGLLPAAYSSNAENIEKANQVMDRYKQTLGFSVCYFLDLKGNALASSNRNDPDNFVGSNYAFRPYFKEALSGNGAVYMAQGITSKARGVYGSYPVKSENGKILGIVVIKKDVKEIEMLLSSYKRFFFITPEGVIFMSGENNAVLRALWPVSQEKSLALKESRQFSLDSFISLLPGPVQDGDKVNFDGRSFKVFRRHLGPPGWSVVFLAPLENVFYFRSFGIAVSFFIGIIILLTMMWEVRSNRAKDLLSESEERFRGAFEAAPIGMALVGLNGRWLKVNKIVCEIMGYPAEELLKKKFQEITHPDDLQVEFLNLRRLLDGETSNYQMEKRYFHKNGNLLWTLLSVSLVRNKKGVPIYFVSQIEDITAQKQDGDRFKKKVEELERFNKIAVARELKMIELKEKIKKLEQGKESA